MLFVIIFLIYFLYNLYALLGQKRTKVSLMVAIPKQSFLSISLIFLYTYRKSFYEEDDNPFCSWGSFRLMIGGYLLG